MVEGPLMSEDAPELSPLSKADSWGQASRAMALSILLGMALAAWAQLTWGGPWVEGFLQKNVLEMSARMRLIYQLIGAGAAFGLVGLGLLFSYRKRPGTAALWEQWAWFLSPALLLPAIPVAFSHTIWAQKHNDFLPIIFFGALIAEFFFAQAARNVPPSIGALYARVFKGDKTLPSNRAQAFVEKNASLILVVIAALAYGAFMSFYTVRWHHKLGTAIFDLGINNNLLYGGLEGKFNQSPVIFPEDPQKYLANHVKLGLYTFLPLYALVPRPETLLVLQSVSLGLGSIPLFLFARRRLPEWWAAALAICYLAYYPMHGANFYEMKVVPTAAAFVLTCIWAIDSKRWITGGIFFLWALIMREDLPVPLAVVGAVFLFSGHRPRAGALMAGIATTWFILIRFRFMNDVGAWWFPNMYEDLWAAPEKGFRGVVKTLFSNPSFTLKHLFVEKKFWYLMHLSVPLMFLPFRRWWAWAALVPGAILTLLVTDYAPPILFSFQYVMHWSPYLFLASALVLGSMLKEKGGKERAFGAITAMCLVSAALSFNYGAFPARDKGLKSGYHKITFGFSKKEAKVLRDVRALVASIPPDASVGATERVGAHLSSRAGFYTLRRGSHGVDYMVARKSGLRLDKTKRTIRRALESGNYGVHDRFGEFIVFKKGGDTKENAKVLSEWKLKKRKSRSSKRKTNKTKKQARPKSNDKKTTAPPKKNAPVEKAKAPTQK